MNSSSNNNWKVKNSSSNNNWKVKKYSYKNITETQQQVENIQKQLVRDQPGTVTNAELYLKTKRDNTNDLGITPVSTLPDVWVSAFAKKAKLGTGESCSGASRSEPRLRYRKLQRLPLPILKVESRTDTS